MTAAICRLVSPFALAASSLALVGCATTEQAMTAPPESRVVMEFRGTAPAGPVVVVVNAQVGVTARPVGIDALNPAAALTAQASDNAVGQGDISKTGGGGNPAGTEQAQGDPPDKDKPDASAPKGQPALPADGDQPAIQPETGAEGETPTDAPAAPNPQP